MTDGAMTQSTTSLALNPDFPYRSYAEYITKLAALDEGFQRLANFFTFPLHRLSKNFLDHNPVPKNGKVVFIDITLQGVLRIHECSINNDNYAEDAPGILQLLNHRPSNANFRLILIDYCHHMFKDMECYAGIDRAVLDAIAVKHHVHPDVLLMHFGICSPDILETSANRITATQRTDASGKYWHILNHISCISSQLCSTNKNGKADTGEIFFKLKVFVGDSSKLMYRIFAAVILSSNYDFSRKHSLLFRMNAIDLAFPAANVNEVQILPWSNDIYLRKLRDMTPEEVALAVDKPILFSAAYAQMALINQGYSMKTWQAKVRQHHIQRGSNISSRYSEQLSTLAETRENLNTLRRFLAGVNHYLIHAHEKAILDYEHQVQGFVTNMTYRASMASLAESSASLVGSIRAKRLT
ncbi:hypothetical protein MMC17_004875 [Xylographa soralifera]|nr:hypothetical protein [Xylographa soralifera]